MLPAYGAGPYLPAIVLERPVYVREMADGLYSPLAYLLYKVEPAPMLSQFAFPKKRYVLIFQVLTYARTVWLTTLADMQMIEELVMATMMSIAFSLPTWYLCQLKGSFFIWWLTWLVSLADGIGVHHPTLVLTPPCPPACLPCLETDVPKAPLCSTENSQRAYCAVTHGDASAWMDPLLGVWRAALAYGTAAVSPNMEVATTVLLTYPTMLLFAAGYLLRWQDIPRYWIWCAGKPSGD